MDLLFQYMENLNRYWEPMPRLHPSPVQLRRVGYQPRKSNWIQASFSSLNFSIILRGGGRALYKGKWYGVVAPCILMQFPGVYTEYGPTAEYGSNWDELYVMFKGESFEAFSEMNYIDLSRPVVPIRSLDWIVDRLKQFGVELDRRSEHGLADWADRAMQLILLDVLLSSGPPEMSPEASEVERIRKWVDQNLHERIDWNELASEAAMSVPIFRKHWKAQVGLPPATYLNQLRMTEAKRLLIETSMQVQEIAERIGIDDALYFSRVFKQDSGYAPREYRKVYHVRAVEVSKL